jgi:hypothetical protein
MKGVSSFISLYLDLKIKAKSRITITVQRIEGEVLDGENQCQEVSRSKPHFP